MKYDNFKIVVQARTGSTRFPNKIVRKVDKDRTFLHILLSRLMELKSQIIVATSELEENDIIEKICNEMNIPVYRGSEHNVLNRYIECSKTYNIENIVRVCSDNPFLDIGSIQKLMEVYNGEDYLSFSINGTPSILSHYGFFTEIVTLKSLVKIQNSQNTVCIEHVTNCIYTNPDEFNINFIPVQITSNNIRCTLDTEEDFKILKHIYFEWFNKTKPNEQSYLNLINFINNNPILLQKMEKQIKENKK